MEKIPQSPNLESREDKLQQRFAEDFNNPETVMVGEAEVEVYDLIPEEIISDTPVLLIPGFGKSPVSYKELLYELYKSGKRVVAVSAPTADLGLELPETEYPKAQVERAYTINEVIKEKGLDQVDLTAHSEGALNGMLAAANSPDNFRHFLLIAPPGITEMQSYFEIVKRGIENTQYLKQEKKESSEELLARHDRSKEDIKSWMKERGVIKGTVESMNPGRVDVSEVLRDLHEAGHGVSVVAGVEDKMLPMDEYQHDHDGEERSAESLGVDGFYSVKKGHAEVEVNGEEIGMLANHALDALVDKYSQPAN